jgi:hypothetical protein
MDERPVKLDEHKAALWRMMYRRTGLSQRLFSTILADKVKLIEFPMGETIDTEQNFYIIYHGVVRMHVIQDNVIASTRLLVAGEMFDLQHIGFFADESIFRRGRVRCIAVTPTVQLFCLAKDDLRGVAHHPLAKGVWQALLIHNLSYVVESYLSPSQRSETAAAYGDRLFRPLDYWEKADEARAGSGQALAHWWAHLTFSLRQSWSPPWPLQGHPKGIRHTQLPPPPQRRPETLLQHASSLSYSWWVRRFYLRRSSVSGRGNDFVGEGGGVVDEDRTSIERRQGETSA